MHNSRRYTGRTRIRACGILVENDSALLAQIHSPITNQLVWLPPGGEPEFGESLEDCLVREFKEETSLEIAVESFRFINELIEPPFHAIELYFDVKRLEGEAKLGYDPELSSNDQLLKDLKCIPIAELNDYEVVPEQLSAHF